MKINNLIIATAVIVVAGRWVQDKPLTPRLVIGAVVFAIALSLMSNASPLLAQRFAVLVLVVAMFTNIPAIAYSAGLTERKPS